MGNKYIGFQKGEKHASADAEISDYHETFEDCGILLTDQDVVIDIDHLSKEQIKEYIRRFDVKTQTVWTERGAHLWFKKPSNHPRAINGVCLLGFDIETKNSRNTPNGITFKRNGVCRSIENEGVREELPYYFYKKKKNIKALVGLQQGDGRNNAIFSYHNAISEFDRKDRLQMLHFVNEVLFAEPLDNKEFETVAREEAVNSGKLTEFEIAEEFIHGAAKCVIYDGSIWFWNGDRYVSGRGGAIEKLIYGRVPGVKSVFVKEVIEQIRMRAEQIEKEDFVVRFDNGYLKDGRFYLSKEYSGFTPYLLTVPYNKDCEPVEVVDEYLKQLTNGDEDYTKLLCESLGYILITNRDVIGKHSKFFMIRGDGGNGKGTLLKVIKNIFGKENCTHLSIKELADYRYVSTMIGKLVNLGDDVEPEAVNNDQMRAIKNITSCDDVEIRHMYKEAIEGSFRTKLFFTTNYDIKTFEKGTSYIRRVVWLPMFNTIEKKDPTILSKLTSKKAREYWVKLIVEGCMRLYENGDFTKSEVIEEYNKEQHIMNDEVLGFIEAVDLDVEIIGRTSQEIKDSYRVFVGDDEKKLNMNSLNRILRDRGIVNVVTKRDGKNVRVYRRIKDTVQKATN